MFFYGIMVVNQNEVVVAVLDRCEREETRGLTDGAY